MKKRIVSFLLALVMAVSLLPVSAFCCGRKVTRCSNFNIGRDYRFYLWWGC